MLSIGLYNYHLSAADFWSLTPRQFYDLSKRFDDGRRADDFGFGIVASTIANCHRDPKKRKQPYQPNDFLPQYSSKRQAKESGNLKSYWENFIVPRVNARNKKSKNG